MAMETRLSLKQRQQLVMTPALQMAIQLLQLSTLELQEVLQQELVENPVLEEIPAEEQGDEAVPDAPPTPAGSLGGEGDGAESQRAADDLPFDLSSVLFDSYEEQSLVDQEEHEALPFENLKGTTTSLAEHLREQLHLGVAEGQQRMIGEAIIGNLDDDGYLRASVEELAEATKSDAQEVETVLALVQSFDPPGVAARDPRECILLQLQAQEAPDPLAIEIAKEHLPDLERHRYPEIARALEVSVERVMEAVEAISQLEPKPGRRFNPADTRYIVPDAYVTKDRDAYRVILNEENLPRLRINGFYRGFLGRGTGAETRAYLEQKFRSALWLIKSVHQRQRTLYRVTESIVKAQRDFLDRGISHLRPLALRDVAEDIGMHESTVSRVTTNKYVQTPQGLFELKYFFHSGLSTGQGGVVSSVAVKRMIENLIAQEESGAPLSDQEIARHLKNRGLTIARRTVAKYREELKILPSHQRRLAPRRRRTEE